MKIKGNVLLRQSLVEGKKNYMPIIGQNLVTKHMYIFIFINI